MKLRYYMRGLGIGMVVTAVIMGIALGGKKESLSDEEVKARARELGMVESTVLANVPGTQQQTETEQTETEQTEPVESEPDETTSQSGESEPDETQPSETKTESSEPDESEPEASQPTDETIIIVIERGESSVSVSKSLAEAGLVPDAKDYDRYLCSNGYDKSIVVGTYEIPADATEEEIAKIITKK